MKKLIFFIAIVLLVQKINAQTTNADCIDAIPLCTTPNFTFYPAAGNGDVDDIPTGSNVSNPSTNPNPPNAGCLLAGENVPQWLLVTIGNAGMLEFVFGAANSPNPQAGCYDWAMWPYTAATCANIANNTLPPIRCNWNATCQNGTGIASAANITAVGGSAGDFEAPLAVSACQQFIICISNYSGVNTLVSFQSLGTASLICTPNCNPNYQICAGGSASVVPVNFAGLTNPTYSMNPGGVTNLTGTFVVSPVVTTTYVTYITGTNAANAVQTTTATSVVEVNPQPSAAPTTTQTTCTSTLNAFNLGLTFNPPSPVPSYTVNWSTPAPNGINSFSQTSLTGGINPGTYTAVITSQGGCTTTTTVTINPIPSPPVFTLVPGGSSYTVTCAQPTVVLTASDPSYTYTWNNNIIAPMTGSATNYVTTSQGNWSVTGVNLASGCVTTHTFSIFVNTTAPTLSVSPINQAIPCGPGVVATATGVALSPTTNVTHAWYSPGVPIPTTGGGQISIFTPIVGTSTYVLTNNINGCSSSQTIDVVSTGGTYPTFDLTSLGNFTLGCSTKSITDITIANGQVPPSGGSVSYTVLPPSFAGGTYTYGTQNVYNITTPGIYTVIVKSNSNNCETAIPISIIQNTFSPDLGTSVITRTLSCDIPTVVLTGTSSTSPVTYTWSFQNGSNPNSQVSSTISVNTTTSGAATPSGTLLNTYTLTIRDMNNFCITTSVVPMWQNTRPPIANIAMTGGSLTCAVFSVNLTNNSSTGILPGTFTTFQPIGGFLWQGPTPQLPKSNSSSYLGYTAGVYTLTAIDLNNGCKSQTTAVIADNRIYPILSTNTLVPLDCGASNTGGVKLPITVLGLPAGSITAQWAIPQPPPNVSGVGTLTLTTDGPGVYKATVQNNVNKCISSITIKVTNGVLNADFTPDVLEGFAPLTVNFTNNSASTSSTSGTSSITTVWSFGNGTTRTTSTNITTSAVYNAPGTYSITIFARKGSCLDTVTKTIVVDIPSKLDVPNVFTPNGDNSNDLFFVKSANLTSISAQIFDRWGNKVYELETDKGNIAWDGKNQAGKEVAAGVYFYTIKATGRDGQNYDTKGTVTLLR